MTQLQLDQVQGFVEQYIRLLANGEIDQAGQLISPGFAETAGNISAPRLIGKRTIVGMDCQRTQCEPHPEGDHILLWYGLRYDRGGQDVILSVIQAEQELAIDGIAVWSPSRHTLSAGPKTRDVLDGAVTATRQTARKRYDILSKVFCGFSLVLLLLGLLVLVSTWIVYEKAGEPGWACIVPFYNMWVLARIGDKPGWLGLLACFCGFIPIPPVGQLIGLILLVVILIGVARTFDRGILFGIGLWLLPFIFYPILAFSKD